MTVKADFNAEDWTTIIQGPALAGMHVLVAESGGAAQEKAAIAESYIHARRNCDPCDLLDAIVDEHPQASLSRYGSPEATEWDEVRDSRLERLRTAAETVRSAATDKEADDYRHFVVAVATRVAQAHKEHSVLGIGGERVTEGEQRAIDDVSAALDAAAPEGASGS
jgi:hypothetical protein